MISRTGTSDIDKDSNLAENEISDMNRKTNIQLNLSPAERAKLRANKVKKSEITDFAVDELAQMLEVPIERAKELYALADFQQIPSVGIRFAEDLIFLGYYSVDELKGLDGAKLTEAYERKKGYWIDPCVEDQFRLVVYFADTHDYSKNWWDFTPERKQYRLEKDYPSNRPVTAWYEVLGINRK
ncbi:MAG: helix-hairpin-helix domain-containing protein [Saprospiraceae bacterium]